MVARIALTHLTFVGATVEVASVEFGSGTTVIRGPSDTGKSFIVDAIDFMLGGGRPLDDIPERQGYSLALLGIELPSGETVTLARSVNGGNLSVYDGDVRNVPDNPAPRALAARHQENNEDTLSGFLLAAIGLDGKRIRRNVNNQTSSLSFRNLAHLCVIDETRMQAETSPALTGGTTSKTAEISTLKLLLENDDDSSLVAVPSTTERRNTASARASVIDRLIADVERQLDGVEPELELRAQAVRLNDSIARYTSSIGEITSQRTDLSRRIVATEEGVNRTQSRISEIGTLISRFDLLSEQYGSDLSRLEMIEEAGNLLGFFNPGQCVFCGADPEHQHFNEDCADDSTSFRESVLAERTKTTSLNADLTLTLNDLAAERTELSSRLTSTVAAINRARNQLGAFDESLRPDQGALNELLDVRSSVEKSIGLYDQIDRLRELQLQLEREQAQETATAAEGIQLTTLANFSAEIAARLTAWGVPGADRTRYDKNEQDVISGDQLRSAHGKGVRAILHSAFTLGLAQYCFDRDLPHPGFVVVDSPLVTYRAPEDSIGEDVLPASVSARFYADVQESIHGQVVVLENTDPPDGLNSDSTDIVFTKNETHGRYGFFPVPAKSES